MRVDLAFLVPSTLSTSPPKNEGGETYGNALFIEGRITLDSDLHVLHVARDYVATGQCIMTTTSHYVK